ncbi:MAG: hypothetical protein EB070_08945 [Synechococcaceae bacterium WBA_2_066]|nr:hypothetical protein [Synechococcaceae bacterium LLD_019]NCU92137.1 hypothetical protein [Synechococcaceae bacterium WB7_1B_046]NDC07505.1 hypothetical protein [Synechococcaceae bacterium WB9_2_069]NDE38641.1 hypothetical protein [Synechococcaceae bacterium WBA_2_066]NDG03237.1 hypothetical protein [Synechococcaceae bacterium WBB_34_004]NDG78272.1 hypothetical protein [Synechococcaceae bacterium WB8_1B_057]
MTPFLASGLATLLFGGLLPPSTPRPPALCQEWRQANADWRLRLSQLPPKGPETTSLDDTYVDKQLQAISQRLYVIKKLIIETYPKEFKSHSGGVLHEGSDGVVSWGQLQAVISHHCAASAPPTAPTTR